MNYTDMHTLWEKAVLFHGHGCPGLAIGCRMVMAAAHTLGLNERSEDEEIMCITETDSCTVDAVQALLGCTLGKGNLFLKIRGKSAMTVYHRPSEKGCRVVWQGLEKRPEKREERMQAILSDEGENRCSITLVEGSPLPKAFLSPSLPCAHCKERTAEMMMRPWNNALYCEDCFPVHSRIIR